MGSLRITVGFDGLSLEPFYHCSFFAYAGFQAAQPRFVLDTTGCGSRSNVIEPSARFRTHNLPQLLIQPNSATGSAID
jgi:hypothetical protein